MTTTVVKIMCFNQHKRRFFLTGNLPWSPADNWNSVCLQRIMGTRNVSSIQLLRQTDWGSDQPKSTRGPAYIQEVTSLCVHHSSTTCFFSSSPSISFLISFWQEPHFHRSNFPQRQGTVYYFKSQIISWCWPITDILKIMLTKDAWDKYI